MDALRRLVGSIAATRVGARILRRILPRLDGLVRALTSGRRTFTGLLLPTLVLETTGHRSGRPRTSTLIYTRDGDDLVVVGSNWGQAHHPAWTANLLADPSALVHVGGEKMRVRAQRVEGQRAADLYARFERMSPNYSAYKGRTGEREIRVFWLLREPPTD